VREKWRNEHKAPDEPERNMKNLAPDVWIPGDKWPIVVHEMKMRIGINAGEIVVGNMGSNMRMNYTMMGDPVNLAARLESVSKQYGVYALVSEYTLDMEIIGEDDQKRKLSDLLEYRFIDNIAVVGKSEPVKVFELCAMQGDLTAQENELFRYFDEGVAHYLKMEWDDAIACFEKALPLERVPEGKTTMCHFDRREKSNVFSMLRRKDFSLRSK
jgi:adenylate cyclase